MNKVRKLEEATDLFEDPRDLASRVNQVHQIMNLAFQLDEPTGDESSGGRAILAVNLLLQLVKPTGGKTTLEE